MRLTFLQDNLSRALNFANLITASRPTLPILSHVLLETDQNRLRVSATDLDTRVDVWIGAKIEQEGRMALPARTLRDFVALLPSDVVAMEKKDGLSVAIACHKAKTNIKGLDADEFPAAILVESAKPVKIQAQTLLRLIAQTVFAAATDESRPMLTAVNLTTEEDQIKLIASDGFRASIVTGQLYDADGDSIGALVPASAIKKLATMMNGVSDLVSISVQHGRIMFEFSNIRFTASLVDQKYPEIEHLMPKSFKGSCIVSVGDMTKACRRASVFARSVSDVMRLTISPKNGFIEVASQSDETGDAVSEVDAEVTGDALTIGVNSKFFSEAIGVLSTVNARIEFGTLKTPVMITIPGDETFRHIVMPITLPK